MTLRIIQVVQEFSLRGGVESVAFELHRAWEAAGTESAVLACVAPENSPARVTRIASAMGRIGTRGRWRYLGRALAVPAFTLAATSHIRQAQRQPGTVVLSHGDSLAGDVCVVHAVNKASLAAKTAAGSRRWMLNPMHAWVALRDRWMIGGLRFRRYVAVSSRVVEELQRYYRVPRERIAVIPNGVNLARFTPDPDDRSETRREFGIAAETPLLVFVGHEFERKGLDFVLEALPHLDPATRLLVVGAGDASAYGRRATALGVAERVVFAGPRSDLPRLYRAGDAFVFPTAYETFALVCMEAMACGLPVFATRAGGIEEYLVDGVNGQGIERNGSQIAAVLKPVLADPDRKAALRKGAIDTAANYSWPVIAERYRALLAEVVRERAEA